MKIIYSLFFILIITVIYFYFFKRIIHAGFLKYDSPNPTYIKYSGNKFNNIEDTEELLNVDNLPYRIENEMIFTYYMKLNTITGKNLKRLLDNNKFNMQKYPDIMKESSTSNFRTLKIYPSNREDVLKWLLGKFYPNDEYRKFLSLIEKDYKDPTLLPPDEKRMKVFKATLNSNACKDPNKCTVVRNIVKYGYTSRRIIKYLRHVCTVSDVIPMFIKDGADIGPINDNRNYLLLYKDDELNISILNLLSILNIKDELNNLLSSNIETRINNIDKYSPAFYIDMINNRNSNAGVSEQLLIQEMNDQMNN